MKKIGKLPEVMDIMQIKYYGNTNNFKNCILLNLIFFNNIYMSKVQIDSVQKFEIAPQNQSSGDASFSYISGNPLISFSLSAADMYLMSDKLRLNFRLQLFDGNNARPNNNDQDGGGLKEVLLNNRIGAASVISNITVSNLQNNVIEYTREYGRMLNSLISSGAGFGEYTSYLGQQFGATSNKDSQGRICNTAGNVAGGVQRSFIEVSMPLMSGVFIQKQPIPLSYDAGTGGLKINIQLTPSISALFGDTASSATTVNSSYKLTNVSLSGEYGIPPMGRLPPIKSLPFTAFQSFYSVINNGDNTQQISPALSAVVSQFSNFIPTEQISSYNDDAFKTTPLLNKSSAAGNPQVNKSPIVGIDFIKSGVKFPLQFKINQEPLLQRNATVNDQYADSQFEAQRQYYYQSSLKSIRDAVHTIGGANSEGLSIANGDTHHNSVTGVSTNGFQNAYGVGCRYDAVGNGSTTSFRGKPFSMRIQSKLDGNSPMSVYTYFLHRGMINFDDNGIVTIAT